MTYAITERCIGCTACARQCPTDAIRGSPEQPHTIDATRCIECGVCGMVCPVPGAVFTAPGRPTEYVPRSRRPRPVFFADDCNGCGACVDLCPFGVLALIGPRYRGLATMAAPEACVSCGDCATACPRPDAIALLAATE